MFEYKKIVQIFSVKKKVLALQSSLMRDGADCLFLLFLLHSVELTLVGKGKEGLNDAFSLSQALQNRWGRGSVKKCEVQITSRTTAPSSVVCYSPFVRSSKWQLA